MNINLEFFKTPVERAKSVAEREKKKRKNKKMTQKELSEKAGVSLASLKRFEQTGEISFVSLIKIADVLDDVEAIDELFCKREYKSIQEVINEKY